MLIYIISVIIALALAFLCGSIPFALIIGKSMRGLDVREHGSGNAGSTNAIRVLGLGPGLLVFAADVFKAALGCIIVLLAVNLSITVAATMATQVAIDMVLQGTGALEYDPLVAIMAGEQASYLFNIPLSLAVVATILGHMFSPFMGFKGGKGVATALGSLLVVLPLAALCALTVFIVIVIATRFVSLGSIIAVSTVPVFTYFFDPAPTYIVFTILVAVVVVLAHRKNIIRLSQNREPRFTLPKKVSS
ncbi:MAG: glycerol-3-phosphate 1-O-acyltransferase PlsY [Coriobacteriales bacterium]|jgi:glycerol-3-phosphate acyltransferase PlsY|nr:glycerol-3-phosphate 1-O-acyltransferase PlsY [Coriobacteriales bacterium]